MLQTIKSSYAKCLHIAFCSQYLRTEVYTDLDFRFRWLLKHQLLSQMETLFDIELLSEQGGKHFEHIVGAHVLYCMCNSAHLKAFAVDLND